MAIARLRKFIQDMTRVVETHTVEKDLLRTAKPLLADLVSHDDWLPDAFAVPNPSRYQQYLLYCDPFERFSLVSFVWGPGQKTPIHDHMVWGMVGILRGTERCEEFGFRDGRLVATGDHVCRPGEVDLVSPTIGDIHIVSNAETERASVSIHCYGGNIGAIHRHVFDPASGASSQFISGYSSSVTPNLWDRSTEAA